MNAVIPHHGSLPQHGSSQRGGQGSGDRATERSPDRQSEPSMEEILASIRRIIADDQAMPAATASVAAGRAETIPAAARAPAAASAQRGAAPAHGTAGHGTAAQGAPIHGASAHDPVDQDAADRGSYHRDETAASSLDEVGASSSPPAGFIAYGQVTAPQFPSPRAPADREVMRRSGEDAPLDAPPGPRGDAAAPDDGERRRDPRGARRPSGAERYDDPHIDPLAEQDSPMRDQLLRDQLLRDEPLHEQATADRSADAARQAALMAPATDQALSSAFNMLAATRLADNSEELRTMARELIRPLLKDWLDDNLPSLVERLVRAEIERVSRGGR